MGGLIMVQRKLTARFALAFWIVLTLGLATQYNACSKVGFQVDSGSSKVGTDGVSTLVINDGARYTQDTYVLLSLSSPGSSEMYITNNSGCSFGGTWQPIAQKHGWVLGATNQLTSVFAKFRASDGAQSKCIEARIMHDNIAPAIIVDQSAPQLTNVKNVSATFHATDSGSGVSQLFCILPGQISAMPCADGKYAGLGLDDGGYMVQFLASDNAGNISAPLGLSFTVDTTPPEVTLSATPPALSGGTSATFAFSGTDNLSGISHFECRLDLQAVYAACATGQSYVGLGDGSHSFAVHAVDNAGNISKDAAYTWVIDTTAPSIEFTKTPPPISNSKNALFAFDGKDDMGVALTQFECRLNGAGFAACTSPDTLSGLTEGKNVFGVRGISAYGIKSGELTYTWTVDFTPPVIVITQHPKQLTNSNTANFVFTATDALTGIAAVTCSLDGGAAADCSAMVQVFANLAGDRSHALQISALDGAGNRTDATPYQWYIDNTPPTIHIDSGPSLLTAQTAATFRISGTDANGLLTYQCRLDSAPVFTTCLTTVKISGVVDGTHTFYAQSIDAAGNLSAVASYSWTVETVGPVITFTKTPLATILDTDHATLSYVVTDPVSTVASVTCVLDNANIACPVPSGTLTFPTLAAGSHTFTLNATNALGLSSSLSYSFTSRTLTCTTILSSSTVPTKMLFIDDLSGSNTTTDPGKAMRAGSIQQFYTDYSSHTNFSWGFETFQGTTATALINSGTPNSPIFSNAAAMQSAITVFKSMPDTGNTPYMAALNMATSAISNDPDSKSATPPQYIVVFMSDGQPNGTGDTTINILNQIHTIVNLLPGRISFNAVYYGPADATASGLIQSMATAGGGNFLNTNTNPTGLDFSISDLVNVPITTCN